MKEIAIENIKKEIGNSFSIITYSNSYFAAPLHIHPEYELILIEEGTGLRFVGDSVHKMLPGNFMLIGSNLPHLWLSADEYYAPNTPLISRSIYTQFSASIFPQDLHNIPELANINSILIESKRGIIFNGENLNQLKNKFRLLCQSNGFEKIQGLYTLLQELATKCNYEYLTTNQFKNNNEISNNPIITKVHTFINTNYQSNISLEDIALNVGMNASALCRYYKKNTGKKIFEYLSELRISYAAKLLTNHNITVSQVAYDCGYNSLSHFNHQFKDLTGYSPSEYAKKIKNKI